MTLARIPTENQLPLIDVEELCLVCAAEPVSLRYEWACNGCGVELIEVTLRGRAAARSTYSNGGPLSHGWTEGGV